MNEEEKEAEPISPRIHSTLVQKREAEWERLVEESSEEIVKRACEPLKSIAAKEDRNEVLKITQEYYQERVRTCTYSAGFRFPGEERDRAMKAPDDTDFYYWCQVGINQRVVDKLRLLRLSLLGCKETPLMWISREEEEAYQLRVAQRQKLTSPNGPRRAPDPTLRQAFVFKEDYSTILNLLEKEGYINVAGQWLQTEKGYKAQIVALMRVLVEKQYLKPLPQATLIRILTRYFQVPVSGSYSSRKVGDSLFKRFAQLIPDQKGVKP